MLMLSLVTLSNCSELLKFTLNCDTFVFNIFPYINNETTAAMYQVARSISIQALHASFKIIDLTCGSEKFQVLVFASS